MNKDIFELGPYYSNGMYTDIKKSMITLSRYKFVSKMLEYKEKLKILELGCNEGLGAYFFMQLSNCLEYVGVDIDKKAIQWGLEKVKPEAELYKKRVEFLQEDFLEPVFLEEVGKKRFNTVISLDVIEHIAKEDEQKYMNAIVENLEENGIAIIGTPNISMYQYQPEATKKVHINMFDQVRLSNLFHTAFHNVFLFSMNDEIVHTGFAPMACYFFAVCCGLKR